MKTVVIDPGHGGHDLGAAHNRRLEKGDTLRLALALEKQLQSMGCKVILTRNADTFVPLLERSEIANQNSADAFISLHRSSQEGHSNPNGISAFIQSNASRVNRAYGNAVLNELSKVGVQNNLGVLEGNYSVLRNTYAPAILVELGFITNEQDNELYDQYLEGYADAIAQGIVKTLQETEHIPPKKRDPIIVSIQRRLHDQYNAELSADGIYGPNTEKELIRALQMELNRIFNAQLKIDGVFGEGTKQGIPDLRRGNQGNIIYLFQAALNANGYPAPLTGKFDQDTENAVKAYQQSHNLEVDGIVGNHTYSSLLSQYPPSASTVRLHQGQSKDPVIQSIQHNLNNLYSSNVELDGAQSQTTQCALIKGLQSELNHLFGAGLSVDGVMGQKTLASLPVLQAGSRGDLVYLLQSGLYMKGYDAHSDGIFGEHTQGIVKEFQKSCGLPEDGAAGENTFKRLFS